MSHIQKIKSIFNQLIDKIVDILGNLMKEFISNNNKDANLELNHFYEYANGYSEKINKTKQIYISNNLKKETKSEKNIIIENYEKTNVNLEKDKENYIQEKLDKGTYKEDNTILIQKIASMEKNINYLMEQYRKNEIEKEKFRNDINYLMEQHKKNDDINYLKVEIKNIKSQRNTDLESIMNLLENKIDKNQKGIIISSEVEKIKNEIEILHKRSDDLEIKLYGLKNEVDILKEI